MFCCTPFLRVVFTPAYPELQDFAKRNFLPQHPLRHSPLWLESRDFKWNQEFFRSANLESPLFIDPTAHDPFHSPYSPLFHQFHLRPSKTHAPFHAEKEGKEGEAQHTRGNAKDNGEDASLTSRGLTPPHRPTNGGGGGSPSSRPLTAPASPPPPSVEAACGEEHVRTLLYDAMRAKHHGGPSYFPHATSSSSSTSRPQGERSPHFFSPPPPKHNLFVPVCTMPTYQSFYVHNADEVLLRDGGVGPSKIVFLQHLLQLRHLQFRETRVNWDSAAALDQELAMAYASLKYHGERHPVPMNGRGEEVADAHEDEEEEDGGAGGPFSNSSAQKNALWRQTFAPPGNDVPPPSSFPWPSPSSSAGSPLSWGSLGRFFPTHTSGTPFNAKTGFAFSESAAKTLRQAQHEKGFRSSWWATALQWKALGCEVVGADGRGGGEGGRTQGGWKKKKIFGQRVQVPVLSKLVHISLLKHPFEILRRSYIDSNTRLLRCVSLTEVELFHEYESLRFQEGDGERGDAYGHTMGGGPCGRESALMSTDSSLSPSSSSSLASDAFLSRLSPAQYLSISVLKDMAARHEKLLARRRVVKEGEDPLFPTWHSLFPTRAATGSDVEGKKKKNTKKGILAKGEIEETEKERGRDTRGPSRVLSSSSSSSSLSSLLESGTARSREAEEEAKEDGEGEEETTTPDNHSSSSSKKKNNKKILTPKKGNGARRGGGDGSGEGHEKVPPTSRVLRPSHMVTTPRVTTTPRFLVIFEKEDIEVFLPLYISSFAIRRQGLRLREEEGRLATPAVFAAPPLIPAAIEILRGTTTHSLLSASLSATPSALPFSSSLWSTSSYPVSSPSARLPFQAPHEPTVVRYFYHLSEVQVASPSTASSTVPSSSSSSSSSSSFPLPPDIWPRLLKCTDPSVAWNGITGERLPFVELERDAIRTRYPALVHAWDKAVGHPSVPQQHPHTILDRLHSGALGYVPNSDPIKPGESEGEGNPTQRGGEDTKKKSKKKRSTEEMPLPNEIESDDHCVLPHSSSSPLPQEEEEEEDNTSHASTFLSLMQRSIWLESTDVLLLGGAVDANVAPMEVQENSEANVKRRRELAWEEKAEKALQMAKEEEDKDLQGTTKKKDSTDSLTAHPLFVEGEAQHRIRTGASPTTTSTFSSATANESRMDKTEENNYLSTSHGMNEDEEKGYYHISALWDVYEYLSRL